MYKVIQSLDYICVQYNKVLTILMIILCLNYIYAQLCTEFNSLFKRTQCLTIFVPFIRVQFIFITSMYIAKILCTRTINAHMNSGD